jgi:transporter family protein
VTNVVPFAASLLIYVLVKPSINIHSLGFGYALLAGVASALGMIGFYIAMEGGKTIIVVPITALYPVITVALAYLILREEISMVKGVGLMLALVSIVLISMD